MNNLNNKKVLLIVASQDYQATEYSSTKEVLESNNIQVIVASDKPEIAFSSSQLCTKVNLTIEQINSTKYNGLFLIGGTGALEFLDKPLIHTLLQQFQILNKPYGAICISTRILAKAGVLKNKKATGWNGDSQLPKIYAQYNITYVDQPVIIDNNVITGDGPSSATDFGAAISQIINAK